MVFIKKGGTQIEISGVATLCFNEEGTWFQGSIVTEDDTQFAIYGTKSPRQASDQEQTITDCCECSLSDEGLEVPVTFDIRVVDCEIGEEYSLKEVHGRNGELCTFSCSSLTFSTQDVYRGHRADMVAQNCLGHKMEGKRTSVYRGPITLRCGVANQNIQWVL